MKFLIQNMKWYCEVIDFNDFGDITRPHSATAFLKMFHEEALESDPCYDNETDRPKLS